MWPVRGREDAAVIKILDDIMEGRDAVWKERAVDGVLKERGYTAEKKQPLGEMARKNTGDFNHTGIDPWIREEGKAKLRPLMEADRTAMVNEYRDTYVRTIEKRLQNRNIRATSSARIRRPSAESYGWIVNKNVRRDNRIRSNRSVLLAPTTDMAKRLKYNYEVYKQGMDQMIQKLETVKVNLLRTHPGFENTNRGEAKSHTRDRPCGQQSVPEI